MAPRHDPDSPRRIGWREWVALPDLGVDQIKVKVDTGARTSAIHAFSPERFQRKGREFVRFSLHPLQRRSTPEIIAEAELLDIRTVRSSTGHREERLVIRTTVSLLDEEWAIDLTLARRDQMGFRMLLGREAIRGRFLVDSSRSYYDRARRPRPKKHRP